MTLRVLSVQLMILKHMLRHIVVLAALVVAVALPGVARAASYAPRQVVVGYEPGPFPSLTADVSNRTGTASVAASAGAPQTAVLTLPQGVSVNAAVAKLRRQAGVVYAVPDYLAHAAGDWIPDDPGRAHIPGGWQQMQWNFLAGEGLDAPQAWANLIADHHPGGRGVIVAVLDTGVAYRNWRHFRRSPDFKRTRFVSPYDFVAHNRYPLDRDGHGTFVAGMIGESTNNNFALTGLAYGASIMPIRVLNRGGTGSASTIARGIRYAVKHHAQVINLSLEFTPDVTAAEIPDLMSALRYASRHHVVVVGAAGNDYANQISYPARASSVISVGATTRDRCVADYSNISRRLDLVAPGGGDDMSLSSDPDCNPDRALPAISQMTFFSSSHPDRFGYPGGIFGTSMSTAEVSATAALVIASRVLGRHPHPGQILSRLEQTTQPLGTGRPNQEYGWGLLDAGAATAPGGPAS